MEPQFIAKGLMHFHRRFVFLFWLRVYFEPRGTDPNKIINFFNICTQIALTRLLEYTNSFTS